MRLGLDVSQHHLTWDEIAKRTRFGEDAGFDGIWVFDHFTALYADPKGPCLEGWTLLAALAAITSRVRLGTLVTGVTYRHPSLLASEAVTVDHISGGRVELAVGAAWHEPEHRRLGFPFPSNGDRVTMLEETLQIMHILMTSEEGESFKGAHFSLEDGWYRPFPVQKPHPPVWVGGRGDRMLRLTAKYADAWHAFGSVEDMTARSATIDRYAEQAGRDPASIMRAGSLDLSQPWDAVRRSAEEQNAAGFTYLVAGWPSEGKPRLDEFVDHHLPGIAAL